MFFSEINGRVFIEDQWTPPYETEIRRAFTALAVPLLSPP